MHDRNNLQVIGKLSINTEEIAEEGECRYLGISEKTNADTC